MALDKSTKALTMTAAGTASATSTTNYKFGGSSMAFTGATGSYIRSNATTSATYNVGLRDFTIEYWFNTTDFTAWVTEPTQCVMAIGIPGSGSHVNTRLFIYHKSSAVGGANTTTLNFHINSSSSPSITTPTLAVTVNIPNGTWHHVAWVRKNGTLYCYLDGVQAGSTSANLSINYSTTNVIQIGGYFVTGLDYPFKGYIDDFRMTLDVARYPVNIAPPTEPTLTGDIYAANVVAGCAFNGSAGSVTATDITGKTAVFGGDAILSSTQSKSGSVSLATGTTGFVDIGASTDYVFGTQNFTVEAWVYLTSLPSTPNTAPIMTTLTSSNIGWRFVISNVGGTYSFGLQPGIGGGANVTFVTPPQINTWYHVAATRVGDTLQLFWNGAFMGSTALTAGFSFQQGNTLRIGRDHTSATQRLNGYVEDVRVTVGAARYVDTGVTSFSAPTSAAPVGFTNYPVIFSTSGSQSARASQTVAIQFTATSQASPLVYTRSSGTLPPGLTLSSTGLLNGTIPSGTSPQVYNFTVRAAAGLSSGELAVTFTVAASGNEYVVTLVHADGNLADATGRQTYVAGTGASVSTAQSKFGGSAMAFTGSSNANIVESTVVNSSDLVFGTNDFTFECWAYFNNFGGGAYPPLIAISAKSGGSNPNSLTNSFSFGVQGSGSSTSRMFFNPFNDGTGGSGNVSLPTGQWHHLAWTRQGAVQRFFANGIMVFNGTPAGFSASKSYPAVDNGILSFGAAYVQFGGGGVNFLNGYIDEVRIANGVALYTANFTPPTAAFNYP